MDGTQLITATHEAHESHFGTPPQAVASAPGRVNLLGEHTDYNGGFVFPTPLDLEVAVAIGYGGEPGQLEVFSRNYDRPDRVALSAEASGNWSDFILGCFRLAEQAPDPDRGYRVTLNSTLPIGAGISSSAAVEVAGLRALEALAGRDADPVKLALIAQKVERDFVGVPCGIMDQFTASVGSQGHALFLDTRSLEYTNVPLFSTHRFIVVHSGATHQLTDGGYAGRVAECQRACDALGVAQLRDLTPADLDRIAGLKAPERNRARHIVTENQRVLDGVEALRNHEALRFGDLMVESHASQRDDYAVSVEEIDALVEAGLNFGAVGARLTGGGFGGSIVALLPTTRIEQWCAQMTQRFPTARVLAEVGV